MKPARSTVFVVDDDPSVLRSLARLLVSAGFNVATFDSPRQFLERYVAGSPGCLVLDLAMPELDGLELQQALGKRGSPLPIVFLTGRGDVPKSVQAMKRGAVDFLTKPADDEALLAAIRSALERDGATRREQAEAASARQRLETLTRREREVLSRLIAGLRNKQIAAALGTTEKTIKVHRARVLEKMDALSLPELVRIAQRAQVEPAPES